MIRHEFDTLVLGTNVSKEDHVAINSFVHEQILKERKLIYQELDNYSNGYGRLQIAKFKLKQIIDNNERSWFDGTSD